MERDRTVRRLTHIQKTASTTRILNLAKISQRRAGSRNGLAPLFKNRILESSIIIKHRVRPHECELFDAPKSNATKVLIPFDVTDFKYGAHCIFVGQKNFDAITESMFGDDLKFGRADRRILELIDELPSLDPFLLREHLRRNGVEPSRDYFSISDADISRMYAYVSQQVAGLVRMAGDGAGSDAACVSSDRLAEKLLSATPDQDFEPLKRVLRLGDKEYLDGIFCWRGFLYYKWVLHDACPKLSAALKEIKAISPQGARDTDSDIYIAKAKLRIERAIQTSLARIRKIIARYDHAYEALIHRAQASAFRQFLVSSPTFFMSLGEELAAIQHIISYWAYWFGARGPAVVARSELVDIFIDFEDGLSSRLHRNNHAWL